MYKRQILERPSIKLRESYTDCAIVRIKLGPTTGSSWFLCLHFLTRSRSCQQAANEETQLENNVSFVVICRPNISVYASSTSQACERKQFPKTGQWRSFQPTSSFSYSKRYSQKLTNNHHNTIFALFLIPSVALFWSVRKTALTSAVLRSHTTRHKMCQSMGGIVMEAYSSA